MDLKNVKITYKQIQALVNGQRVFISYRTLGEYGGTDQHDIELVPEERDMSDENNRA